MYVQLQGWTALHHASSRGHDSIVATLLSLGANAAAETPNVSFSCTFTAYIEGPHVLTWLVKTKCGVCCAAQLLCILPMQHTLVLSGHAIYCYAGCDCSTHGCTDWS